MTVVMCDHQTLVGVKRACGGKRESLAAQSEPFSKVSSLAPLQNIPVRDGGKYIIPNDASPRVAECWASGERTGGDIWPGPRR